MNKLVTTLACASSLAAAAAGLVRPEAQAGREVLVAARPIREA